MNNPHTELNTLKEYDEAVKTLTSFQKRVLDCVESFPNSMANTWEIAWNGFAKEWSTKISGHGALIRNIINAGNAMRKKGIVVILTPRDQHDSYTLSSNRKWIEHNEKSRDE